MNTYDDELELQLSRDLHRQVDTMTGVPHSFEAVRGRATRIRRNRRITTGVGVAAALAVIVPVGLLSNDAVRSQDEIQPAPSPAVPVEVSRTTLTLEGLSRGEVPAVEYFTPDGVVVPDEGTQPLTENFQALVRSEAVNGWVALGAALDEVVYLTEDFERLDATASGNTLATTPARDYVAWTVPGEGEQTIEVRSTSDPDQLTSWNLPARPVVNPVGILGPDSLVYEAMTPQGETTVGLANASGITTELPYLGVAAADPVNGVFSVQTESRPSGGCFAVVQAASLETAWETCDYALGSFSTDGSYVMASAAESDGAGPSMLYVLDAGTGELVAEYTSQGRNLITLIRPTWESADTIVATASQGNVTTMVRMGIDGTLEEIVDPVSGSAFDNVHYYVGQDRAGL